MYDEKNNKDFLQGVWNKVRYLEYKKWEEEKVKENRKKIRKRNKKIVITFIPITIVTVCLVLVMMRENVTLEYIISFILAIGTLYERILNSSLFGGDL
ncbi:hypothetical protein [Dethiothermospora halolimnae]|uniref:hypothetical protein n=1 Tax=Dethiothermospora halolimnae TaxID=3114390 RepID=UPI003CCB9C4F